MEKQKGEIRLANRRETILRYFEEHADYMNDRVKNGVEKHRKGTFKILLADANGASLSGVQVRYRLKNHAFRHGANVFMLDEFAAAEHNEKYRTLFAKSFNLATLPFYWKDQEPEKGQKRYAIGSTRRYRRPPTDLCVEYCLQNGIEPKAHCLNYDFMRPTWLYGASTAEYKAALEARFAELSARYAAVIPSWEVTNETFNVPFARTFLTPNYSAFYLEKDYVAWSFEKAAQYFPNNRLIINDHTDFGCMRSLHGDYFGVRSPYYMQIERLIADNAHRIDSIGFQYHCFFSREDEAKVAVTRYNPVHLYDILDTYATLGRKLQITEMTVSALGDSRADEELQAELIYHLYRIFFSHQAMEAIVYWNLPDGYASAPVAGDMTSGENRFYGGLYHPDLTEKPAIRAIDHLFKKEWHTEGEVAAPQGEATFRGFYGDYTLQITHNGRTTEQQVCLDEAQNEQTVVVTVK